MRVDDVAGIIWQALPQRVDPLHHIPRRHPLQRHPSLFLLPRFLLLSLGTQANIYNSVSEGWMDTRWMRWRASYTQPRHMMA